MANYVSSHTGSELDAAINIANSLASWAKANTKPSYTALEISVSDISQTTNTNVKNCLQEIYTRLGGLGTAATKSYTTSVTSGSTALVTSGAVYTALNNLPSGGMTYTQLAYNEVSQSISNNSSWTYTNVTKSMVSSYKLVRVSFCIEGYAFQAVFDPNNFDGEYSQLIGTLSNHIRINFNTSGLKIFNYTGSSIYLFSIIIYGIK